LSGDGEGAPEETDEEGPALRHGDQVLRRRDGFFESPKCDLRHARQKKGRGVLFSNESASSA
jgi:hypothetical protein